MIPDYDNDVKMAELGRNTAKWKAIKQAKEAIRDSAVLICNNNYSFVQTKALKDEIDEAFVKLIEALELK